MKKKVKAKIEIKLDKIYKLVRLVNEGCLSDDGAGALTELKELTIGLMFASGAVINNWERNLASSVNDLESSLRLAIGGR